MKVLLVIDVQKEFKDKNGVYNSILTYIKSASAMGYDKVVATVFVNEPNSVFVNRLGWSGCMGADENSLEFEADYLIIKQEYAVDIENYFDINNDEIDVVGCDLDACVLATCFRLFDAGYRFYVLKDYVYTNADNISKETVLDIVKRNFGNIIK